MAPGQPGIPGHVGSADHDDQRKTDEALEPVSRDTRAVSSDEAADLVAIRVERRWRKRPARTREARRSRRAFAIGARKSIRRRPARPISQVRAGRPKMRLAGEWLASPRAENAKSWLKESLIVTIGIAGVVFPVAPMAAVCELLIASSLCLLPLVSPRAAVPTRTTAAKDSR
jgi:hypothetical protein